ncbi:MAG: uracil phosphoribosyltransferase [Deferribacterota bacterium]|nr:uracil phosphoribosyltransferase [Deferribacterota bacterium]
MYSNLKIINHPLVKHKLTKIRDYRTTKKEFKELLDEVSMLMAYEITKDLPLKNIKIKTPMTQMVSPIISGKKVVLLPILRAGVGMIDGVLKLIPSARVGHIGIYRDHDTLKPVVYYFKVPNDCINRNVIILDPMLATGGSIVKAVDKLIEVGVKNIKIMCLIAAPEGVEYVNKYYPDLPIYVASLDECLNEDGYIMPGLGDAGDRLFGTK